MLRFAHGHSPQTPHLSVTSLVLARYEPHIRDVIAERGLEAHHFHARKGDVLIWQANLLHGGSERRNLQLSRKAVVCHFFVKGGFVYHDLAAARSRQQYLGTYLNRGLSRLGKRGMTQLL